MVNEATAFGGAIVVPDNLYLFFVHHDRQVVIIVATELVHWRILLLFTLSGQRPRREVV